MIGSKIINKKKPIMRIELMTLCLQGKCSATELNRLTLDIICLYSLNIFYINKCSKKEETHNIISQRITK